MAAPASGNPASGTKPTGASARRRRRVRGGAARQASMSESIEARAGRVRQLPRPRRQSTKRNEDGACRIAKFR